MTRIGEERLLAFDFGLNALRRGDDVPHLPPDGPAPAADTEAVLHLAVLFGAPGLDEALQAMSAPEVADPKALEPAAYVAALNDAHDLLLGRAAAGGADAAIFTEALLVLEAAQVDRDVLTAAQSALMRV